MTYRATPPGYYAFLIVIKPRHTSSEHHRRRNSSSGYYSNDEQDDWEQKKAFMDARAAAQYADVQRQSQEWHEKIQARMARDEAIIKESEEKNDKIDKEREKARKKSREIDIKEIAPNFGW